MSRRLELDGRGVDYQDIPGATEAAPLLLLHDGLGSVGLWRGLPERLAAASGRRTVAYSRLGHGSSDPPARPPGPGALEREAAEVLPALCQALGLYQPVLLGHSDGATIALLHAASHAVTGVAVIAPHVFAEEVTLRAVAQARADFRTGGALRERLARHHADPDVTFAGWADAWLAPGFRGWDIRATLRSITAPVLAIQGTCDPYGTRAHVDAIAANARGPVELLLLDCGHAPHMELPEETEAALVRFVSSLPDQPVAGPA